MNKAPTDAAEDTLLEFPCDFPIKAMGHADVALDEVVAGIVRRHAPDLSEAAIKVRASSGGRYTAVTVVVRATSKAQLDAIYMELTACEHVLMSF